MKIKVGDKFLVVWDTDIPEGTVMRVTCLNVDYFSARNDVGRGWSYLIKDLKAYGIGNKVYSILTPMNTLSKLLYLGE